MVDEMQDNVKHVIEILRRPYETEKYGKLHRTLLKEGIETDLYIGFGIEIHYPNVYNPSFTLHVFDKENLVILDKRELTNKEALQKMLNIVTSLGYKIKSIEELTEKEWKKYFV